MKITLLLFVAISQCSDGSKIFGIIPTASYSHQVAFQPLWRELSLRGHQVTVITTDPVKDPLLVNLTEIDFHFSYEKFNEIIHEVNQSYFNGIDVYLKHVVKITETQLQHPQLQQIIRDKSQTFDVLLIEYINPTYFSFGEIFKCPIIGISTLAAPSMAYNSLGSPAHAILYPEMASPYSGKLNFYERIITTFFSIGISYVYDKYSSEMQSIARKHTGIDDIDLQTAMKNMDMLFVNSNPILNTIRPLTPNIIEVGGGNHFKPSKPLPMELQTYLDNAKNGFIYFSLGTNAKSKHLSKSLLNVFLQTFSKLPYKVLWKFEDDSLPGLPPNVMISKWLPQQDVLRHPNIKLFIYQCGWQSTEEAILSKVPVLAIPMIGDQKYNARIIANKGMGLSLDKDSLSEDDLKSTIFELIDNPKYRTRVEELADLIVDQPMTGLEKAVWWTEYVIRHKGAKHFKSLAIDIPLYQYFFLDIIGFCIFVLAGVMILLFILVKFVSKLLNCLTKHLKLKSD